MNIPKIRFPEFKDEWDVKRLDDFLTLLLNPISKPKDNYLSVGIRSHFKGTFQKPNTDPNKNVMNTLYSLKENNLVVNITFAWEGALAIVPKEDEGGLVSHRFPTYDFNKEKVSYTFFKYLFFRNKFKHELGIISPGGAGRNRVLNKSDFLKLKCLFPTIPEQKRIAHFFTVLDKKINQLKEKKALLKDYKKGMMQKIFSQEIRFKNDVGKEFVDWEEFLYGDIFSFYSTNSLSRDHLNYKNGKVKNIHYGDIHTKFELLFSIKNEVTPFINENVNISKIPKENYCQVGDLVIADASEDYSDIGKSIEIIDLNNEKVLAGLHTILARSKNGKMALGFTGYLMKSQKIRKQIMVIAQGTKVLGLSSKQLAKIKIEIPSLPEQTKIANFLSKIDDKINTVNEQIEESKEYKKGLLQRMYCV